MVKVKKLTILNFLGFAITSILVMCNYTKKFDNASSNFIKIYKNHLLKKSANILAVIASPKKILLISLILISFISIILLIFNKWNKINNISDNLKLLLFTILIGLSRVYLGKHFMTDIIGGYFLSGFILCFLIWIICSISKYSINEQKI
ncbi:phosphatase PAP2 family protein [Clostridium coskatii]|uniref:PAP2 superfamily protein n=1 Tax=Clostridium coskatii TaxID=1705578 RepID=A0A166SX79_9CLOT|nr:phosphatase PAP2 family protein [Clostridium coskatii]OAA92894.1 PAP2 superfamily protein [Clostridium coskatii]OBR95836.1 PAP2 superfamily protein [Clostridium coskatii]